MEAKQIQVELWAVVEKDKLQKAIEEKHIPMVKVAFPSREDAYDYWSELDDSSVVLIQITALPQPDTV